MPSRGSPPRSATPSTETARRASSRPAMLRLGWGVERNRNGASAIGSALALWVLAGQFGTRGAGVIQSTSDAAAMADVVLPATTRTINSIFGEHRPPPAVVTMHPADADERDIADGDDVRVFNDLAELRLPARIDVDVSADGASLSPPSGPPRSLRSTHPPRPRALTRRPRGRRLPRRPDRRNHRGRAP